MSHDLTVPLIKELKLLESSFAVGLTDGDRVNSWINAVTVHVEYKTGTCPGR